MDDLGIDDDPEPGYASTQVYSNNGDSSTSSHLSNASYLSGSTQAGSDALSVATTVRK